jgi:hypothetical protein
MCSVVARLCRDIAVSLETKQQTLIDGAAFVPMRQHNSGDKWGRAYHFSTHARQSYTSYCVCPVYFLRYPGEISCNMMRRSTAVETINTAHRSVLLPCVSASVVRTAPHAWNFTHSIALLSPPCALLAELECSTMHRGVRRTRRLRALREPSLTSVIVTCDFVACFSAVCVYRARLLEYFATRLSQKVSHYIHSHD